MARYRTIKPKFWDDIKISKVSRDARLVFIGMWSFCDDLGVIVAEPVFLKSKILPYDAINSDDFDKLLQELVQHRFLIGINYNKERFFFIRTFSKHQKVDKPNLDELHIDKQSLDKLIFDEQSSINRREEPEQSKKRRGRKAAKRVEESSVVVEESSVVDTGSTNLNLGEVEKEGLPPPKKNVQIPFGEDFKIIWEIWKDYRKKQHDFIYKSEESEQAALVKLYGDGFNNEKNCIEMIKKSMANGWKGLFSEKNNNHNGTHKPTGSEVSGKSIYDTIMGGGAKT